MKIFVSSMSVVVFTSLVITSCADPEKELPRGTLTGNEWFVEKGNPNAMYVSSIWLKFQGGSVDMPDNTVEAWEGGTSTRSCICDGGHYKINEERNQIVISGLNNVNCPWMSALNGTYNYRYDESRDGYNKYMFSNAGITLTHLFDESR